MKIKDREYRISGKWFFLLVCMSLFILLIWTTPQTVSKSDSIENVIKGDGDYSLLCLGENDTIKQNFSIKGDRLDSIELLLVGFSTDSRAEVVVKIYDDSSVFEKTIVPLKQFVSGEFTKINLDKPLSLKKNKLYTLELNVEKLNEEEAPRVCFFYDSTTNGMDSAWIVYNEQNLPGNVLASKYDFSYDYISAEIRSLQWLLTTIVVLTAAGISLVCWKKKKFVRFKNLLYSHEKLLFGILTVLMCALYCIGPMEHTIPWTEGWGEAYADLMDAGKFPYRDFYYYMPPADLLFTWVLWKISFRNLFIYSCYRLIERLLIFALMYYIIVKFSKPIVAALSTFIGCVVLSAVVYDLIGDYNQSALLYIEVLCILLIQYLQEYYSRSKSSLIKLFCIGLCIGASFWLKQPLFISEALITFFILTAFFVRNSIPKYFKSLLTTISGILIPIGACFTVMLLKHALPEFINQVFLTNSKGNSLIDMFLVAFRYSLKWSYAFFILILAFVGICVYKCNNCKLNKKSGFAIAVLLVIWIGLYYEYYVDDFIKNIIFSKIGCILLGCIIGLSYLWFIDNTINLFLKKIFSLFLLIFPCLAIYFMPEQAEKLYGNVDYFSLLTDVVNISFWLGIIFCIYLFKGLSEEKKGIIFAGLGAGIMFCYMRAMGTLDSIPTASGALICAIVVALGMEHIRSNSVRITICSFCIIVSLIGMSQKVINSYSWWGWSESKITQDKQHEIDIPGLRGYKVDLDTKNMYENIYEVIRENSKENSTIYGFPYVKIFNVLLDNTNATWFVPVPFYDVCSDYYAELDAENLANNPPDIVVWCDIPNCMETHEAIFRNGNSLGQREIQKWFSLQVSEKKYVLVGQYNNLFVYKKNDKGEKLYKSIQDKSAVNQTLIG